MNANADETTAEERSIQGVAHQSATSIDEQSNKICFGEECFPLRGDDGWNFYEDLVIGNISTNILVNFSEAELIDAAVLYKTKTVDLVWHGSAERLHGYAYGEQLAEFGWTLQVTQAPYTREELEALAVEVAGQSKAIGILLTSIKPVHAQGILRVSGPSLTESESEQLHLTQFAAPVGLEFHEGREGHADGYDNAGTPFSASMPLNGCTSGPSLKSGPNRYVSTAATVPSTRMAR